ncbi:MAG: hypothetical protein HZB46_13790 [Solirubrobacterales bacterium]|nr:hypothetical protein [Solirubrobacterales bacterium]
MYRLTAKGRAALEDYARTPVRFTPVKSEALLRLLLADLVGEPVTRAALLTLREDVADLFDRLEETDARAAALPHRAKYLHMVNRHLRRLLDLHLELLDEVERELTDEP